MPLTPIVRLSALPSKLAQPLPAFRISAPCVGWMPALG